MAQSTPATRRSVRAAQFVLALMAVMLLAGFSESARAESTASKITIRATPTPTEKPLRIVLPAPASTRSTSKKLSCDPASGQRSDCSHDKGCGKHHERATQSTISLSLGSSFQSLPTKTAPVTQPVDLCAGIVVQPKDKDIVQPAIYAQEQIETPFADDSASTSSSTVDARTTDSSTPPGEAAASEDPCAALTLKSMRQVDIGIAAPAGLFPTDFATGCWTQVNRSAGPCVAARDWAGTCFFWDATCLCYRPLYFEEINLERYGYGCCESLQPAASAAHFFGSIPLLPYCMAVDCPGDCIYTLGHYRPGSCPPKRYHWPPCDPLAVLSEGGVWTGMVFLIP